MSKCFVIMPISTPEEYLSAYNDDLEHFSHVLECLFLPSIKEAGYEPILPIAEGADIIHARIISNLELADIVLCDMSTLNANVFFELGIRTALNKPVCIVKDNLTDSVPFDTGIINYFQYNGGLNAWGLNSEIQELAAHLNKSYENVEKQNSLWKYFGLSRTGTPHENGGDVDDKLEYITQQINALRKEAVMTPDSTQTLTSLLDVRHSIEKAKLIEALQHCNGNTSKVARVLGISRPSVFSLKKKYDIKWPIESE